MTGLRESQGIGVMSAEEKVVQLADGDEVPAYLVDVLDELDRRWPGATLPGARPAIVKEILRALDAHEDAHEKDKSTRSRDQ
jgi:hypothetical protein